MRTARLTTLFGGLLLAAAATAQAQTQGARVEVSEDLERNWGLLDSYCAECHNFIDWAGGVAFDTMQPQDIAEDWPVWEETVRKLRGRLMPPPGHDQPEQPQIDAFVAAMENHLDRVAELDPNPGYVQAHRLNRTEYARAVEALLAVQVEPDALLPRDGQVSGFDNIASGLTVSPTFVDDYIAAARDISVRAVGLDPREAVVELRPEPGTDQTQYVPGLPPGTRGGLLRSHFFPADGEYVFNLFGLVSAGYVTALDYPHTLIMTIDGRKVFEGTLGGDEDRRAVDQRQAAAVEEIRGRFENIRIPVSAGVREVGVTFIGKTLSAPDGTLYSFVPDSGLDRVPTLGGVEIVGPFEVAGVGATPSRERIFVCYPQTTADEDACAERIITQLADRAYRGLLSEQDLETLLSFYQRGYDSGGFESGIQQAVMAVLASPKFLYRTSLMPDEEVAANGVYRISELELASRLAFFLWSQIPDEELLEAARGGELRDPDGIERQVRRMLADPRSESLVTHFAFQWLGMQKMDEVNPDPELFPEFNGALRAAFRREMELFTDSILRADRPITELLTADHTYLNERLARHYGISDIGGSHFRRVHLDESQSHRRGLLGKGAILMATSFANRTSPVMRGDWILKTLLGTPPAPPPPDVETDLSEPPEGERLTVRELLEVHREVQSCNACHGVIDPPGVALENFDVTGQWREMDRYARVYIDAHGHMPDGTPLSGVDDVRDALLRRPEQFALAFTEKLMMYALGRQLAYYDMPAVRAITRAAAQDDYRFSSILMGVVQSDAFQMRRIQQEDRVEATEARTGR